MIKRRKKERKKKQDKDWKEISLQWEKEKENSNNSILLPTIKKKINIKNIQKLSIINLRNDIIKKNQNQIQLKFQVGLLAKSVVQLL